MYICMYVCVCVCLCVRVCVCLNSVCVVFSLSSRFYRRAAERQRRAQMLS